MIFKGIPVSPGIAIGRVFVMEKEAQNIHKRSVPQNEIKGEVARFRKAIAATKKDIIEIEKRVKKEIGSKPSQIFEGYRMFLNDKILIFETEEVIRKQNVNAEFAFSMQLKKVISSLSALKNDYLKE